MLKGLKNKIFHQKRAYSLGKIYKKFSNFTMLSERTYIDNLILGRRIKNVDGCIIECGVWRGGMIAGLADLLGEKRNYHLFDSFQGLPQAREIDGKAALQWQSDKVGKMYHDNCFAPQEYAEEAMSMSRAKSYTLHKGWFEETLVNVDIKEGIALLRLDADWYKSTKTCLDTLFQHVNKGGLVILDDYYTWDGCSKALHDFLSHNSRPERIDSFNGICFLLKSSDEQY